MLFMSFPINRQNSFIAVDIVEHSCDEHLKAGMLCFKPKSNLVPKIGKNQALQQLVC